jgi:hypothetical protein
MSGYTVQQIPPEPHPQRRPGYRAPDQFVVRGTLPPGPFVFQHPPWGTAQEPQDQGVYEFDQVRAVDGEFTLDRLFWSSCHSSYTRCVFRQTGKAASKTQGWRARAGGLLGRCPSTYQDCTFDHVDFGLRDGGFLLGEARFERCTFRYCSYRWFRATHADFIDCTFIGVMQSAWFWGATPKGDERPRRNQFTGNDLSRAKPRRVLFRNGLDLSTNRLPEDAEYLYLDRFRERLERARAAVAAWPEEERRHAEILLDIYEQEDMDVLFSWRRSLAGRASPVWALLEALELPGQPPATAKTHPAPAPFR